MSKMLILFDIAQRLGLYSDFDLSDIEIYDDFIGYWDKATLNRKRMYETEILYAIQDKIRQLKENEE